MSEPTARLVVFLGTDNPGRTGTLLKALDRSPEKQVACVLSPTLVDFSISPSNQSASFAGFGHSILDNLQRLSINDGLPPPLEVRADSWLYLSVVALRTYGLLIQSGRALTDCQLYRGDLSRIGGHLYRPRAFRAANLLSSFDPSERARVLDILSDAKPGDELRRRVREICHHYVETQSRELGLPLDSLIDPVELINSSKSEGSRVSLLIDGPFTEAFQYLQEMPTGMVETASVHGGSLWSGLSSSQPLALSHTDMDSAIGFLEHALSNGTAVTFLAIEAPEDSAWQLRANDMDFVFQEFPDLKQMIIDHDPLLQSVGPYKLPGLVMAAIVLSAPEDDALLPPRKISCTIKTAPNGEKIVMLSEDPNGRMGIWCKQGATYMKKAKSRLLDEMRLHRKH